MTNPIKIFCAALLLLLSSCSTENEIESPQAESNIVVLETTLGNIVIQLDSEKAPISAANFINYVSNDFYDGLIFHRVINDFMIQGGGFDQQMNKQSTNPPIQNEANNGLLNEAYTIAMARTGQPHSATSQFFINVKDNAFLNFRGENGSAWGYAVFGKVIEGTDVVDQIKVLPTRRFGAHGDVPVQPVVIERAYLK